MSVASKYPSSCDSQHEINQGVTQSIFEEARSKWALPFERYYIKVIYCLLQGKATGDTLENNDWNPGV